MADSMAGYELRGEAGGFSAPGLDRATVERILHSEEGKNRGVTGPPEELAPALIKLARSKQEAGQYAEAEALFVQALAIHESQLGPDHPDLVLLLNDLALLYLRQSQYAAAEPLLLRLLDIKRRKGEDHPEVATVLGSLALTQRALGRHESAEGLLRRVLEIRERTLAPNHFLVAAALEQLAEACEARGKVSEALQLFQRAYMVREVTLGVEHPSMRACRERIADIQLQSSEGSMALVVASVPVSTQYRYPLVGIERTQSDSFGLAPNGSHALAPLRRTRPFVERDPSPLRSMAYADAESFERIGSNTAGDPPQGHVPYRDVLLGIEDDQEAMSDKESLADHAKRVFAGLIGFLVQRQAASVAAVVVIAVAVVALTTLRTPADEEVGTATIDNGLSHSVAALAAPASIADVSRTTAIAIPELVNSRPATNAGSTTEPLHARTTRDRSSVKSEGARNAEPK